MRANLGGNDVLAGSPERDVATEIKVDGFGYVRLEADSSTQTVSGDPGGLGAEIEHTQQELDESALATAANAEATGEGVVERSPSKARPK